MIAAMTRLALEQIAGTTLRHSIARRVLLPPRTGRFRILFATSWTEEIHHRSQCVPTTRLERMSWHF